MSSNEKMLLTLMFLAMTVLSESKPITELEEELQEHFLEQARFKCGKPRERVFRVSELYKKESIHKNYMPHCVVLSRCGNDSGCCPEGYTCEAKAHDTISKVFLVTDAFGFNSPKTLKFRNDTECHCKSNSDLPRIPVITAFQLCVQCGIVKDSDGVESDQELLSNLTSAQAGGNIELSHSSGCDSGVFWTTGLLVLIPALVNYYYSK